jgi:hypothetical protein
MPPLSDRVIMAQFRKVLAEWNCTGYVTAKEVARNWIASNLGGLDLKAVAKAMHDFMVASGVPDHSDCEYPRCLSQIPTARSQLPRRAGRSPGTARIAAARKCGV